jgi:hypothetical protein
MSDWYLRGGKGLADPNPDGDWYLKGGKYIAKISNNSQDYKEENDDEQEKGE